MQNFISADGRAPSLAVGKVVCVGRNYADHVKELDNPTPEQPILFMKPASSVVDVRQPLVLPQGQGECHNELELAVLIGKPLCKAEPQAVADAIAGYGLGLDLTLRDAQTYLKSRGLPWELAKGFDGACPVTPFVGADGIDPTDLSFTLTVNGEQRQHGNTACMTWPVLELIAHISQYFSLSAGDLVLTGTPKGVGPLYPDDQLTLTLSDKIDVSTYVQPQGSVEENSQ